MRRLLTLLLLGALLAVTVLPDDHPAQRTVEEAAETVWSAGEEAVQVAREALSEQRSEGKDEAASNDKAASDGGDPRSRERGRQRGGEDVPMAGRAALTDRLTARVDRRADRVALAAPASAERSVEALAGYLKREAGPTMRGRTRAAFRWVADHVAYDVSLTRAERMIRDTQSPAAVLEAREAVCEGYAKLFVALIERMGLEAAYITGEADPAGPGGGGGHAWASVRLADGWYLLDPTWAAGGVRDDQFISRFDEEWWLVAPERMGRTHRPSDQRWALQATSAQPGLLERLF